MASSLIDNAQLSTESHCRYLADVIIPTIDPIPESINVNRRDSDGIGAQVVLRRDEALQIWLHTGGIKAIRLSLTRLDEACEDTVAALMASQGLGGREAILDTIAIFANLFILLHEYAHIAAGHFNCLLSNNKSAGERFSETGNHFCLAFGSDEKTPSDDAHLFEIEADALAFHLLYALRHELYEALCQNSPDFSTLQPATPPFLKSLGEVAFYGAALAIALLDVEHRKRQGESDSHPWPFTRVLHLSEQLFASRFKGETPGDGLAYINIEPHREALQPQFIEPLVSSYCFIQVALENLHHNISGIIQPNNTDPKRSFVAVLGADLSSLILKREQETLLTYEALQWQRLKGLKSKFDAEIAPFRRVDWWQRS